MSELNREQIIKALECCVTQGVACRTCPLIYDKRGARCYAYLKQDALSLIKELTEENERLRADNDRLIKEAVFSPMERAKNTNIVRANTVRKMSALLNAQIDEITRSRIELRAFPFAALLAERMKVIVAETAKKVEEGSV